MLPRMMCGCVILLVIVGSMVGVVWNVVSSAPGDPLHRHGFLFFPWPARHPCPRTVLRIKARILAATSFLLPLSRPPTRHYFSTTRYLLIFINAFLSCSRFPPPLSAPMLAR